MNRQLRNMFNRHKHKAPATIIFGFSKKKNKQMPCVFARCENSEMRTAPVWGQSEESQRRALAMLTRICECPARFHTAVDYEGKPISDKATPPPVE